MKVLWLSHLIPYPPKGGVLQRAFYLFRGVARRHDVRLLCFNQKSLLKTADDIDDARNFLSSQCTIEKIISIPSDRGPWHRRLIGLKSLMGSASFTQLWLESGQFSEACQRMAKEYSPDVVHFDTISLSPYSRFFRNSKLVLNHHNIESQLIARRASNESQPFMKVFYAHEARKLKEYERKVSADYDLHITCSKIDSMRLVEIFDSPSVEVKTIPNGVDATYFTPSRKEESNMDVLFVGGMGWYPNRRAIQVLVRDVWPRVIQRIPDAKLTIVGRSPADWLLSLAEKRKDISVPGFVEDIRPYFDRAAVFACPIDDGGGTKLKLLDAMAMRKAIVTYPIACEGIDVVDGQHVVMASCAAEMADNILDLLSSPDKRDKLGVAARGLVREKYDFVCIGEHLSNIYAALGGQDKQTVAAL